MTIQATTAAEWYLRRVRAELADLPAPELDEVMQETASHLTEVSAELSTEATLETHLGSPQQYADQLRSAAGYPPRPNDHGPTSRGTAALVWLALSTVLTPLLLIPWFAMDFESSRAVFILLAIGLAPATLSLRALRGHAPSVVTDTPLWRRNQRRLHRLADRLPSAIRRDLAEVGHPVWWVLRGILGGISLYGVLARNTDTSPLALAGVLGALASIYLARLSQRNRHWLWLLVPLNSLAVLAVAILLIGGTSAWGPDGYNFSGVHQTRF
jgi:hypothetical protein